MSKVSFADRLFAAVRRKNSCVLAGIDPWLESIPSQIKSESLARVGPGVPGAADAIQRFSTRLVRAVAGEVAGVKIQVALFERYGWRGIKAMEEVIGCAKELGLLVVADAKRGDIGHTSLAYAEAYFGSSPEEKAGIVNTNATEADGDPLGRTAPACGWGVDALTVNPYTGREGLEPFVLKAAATGRGVFVLVRSSVAGPGHIQELLTVSGRPVWEEVARLVGEMNEGTIGSSGYGSVGAVVGATRPEDASKLRQMLPGTLFLVPGYGAQGAGAEDAASCFDGDGCGAVVSSSRHIAFAFRRPPWDSTLGEDGFEEAAKQAAREMKDQLNSVLRKSRGGSPDEGHLSSGRRNGVHRHSHRSSGPGIR